jgi:deoxyribonuclease-4
MKPGRYPILGAHFSIAKGLHHALYEAKTYGCTALQIFTKNASTWKERTLTPEEIDRFHQARKETGVTEIVSHTAYLINLATSEREKHVLSCNALANEMIRSSKLDIPFTVLHPGAHMGRGEEKGIEKIAAGVNEIFEKTPAIKSRLLFETTAGQGSGIGYAFEQLAAILDKIENQHRCGICLDTSHIFAAGYDIRTKASYLKTMAAFDAIIGIKNLFVIHLNDSKKGLGSRVDRHEHIGEGNIGMAMFKLLMNDQRFKDIPKIIETPKHKDGFDADKMNLRRLRTLIY